ncbi:MAG: hypothetical protein LBI70_01590 [Rickettsiales bacterium]|jgi:XTP/dITP diphosphohydrolase|nr:hypothetical protein [Rickettsiales bacterium]
MQKKMFLASSNEDKIREISILLGDIGIELKSLEDYHLKSPKESGKTFEDNALLKARFGFRKTGLTTIADDSGFCLEALNGFPGIFSGRFAQNNGGFENAAKLIRDKLGDRSGRAFFITVVALVQADGLGGQKEYIFDGKVDGYFCYPPRGTNGFGYCSCFMPDNFKITYGEMDSQLRMSTNHRAVALGKLREFLVDGTGSEH